MRAPCTVAIAEKKVTIEHTGYADFALACMLLSEPTATTLNAGTEMSISSQQCQGHQAIQCLFNVLPFLENGAVLSRKLKF